MGKQNTQIKEEVRVSRVVWQLISAWKSRRVLLKNHVRAADPYLMKASYRKRLGCSYDSGIDLFLPLHQHCQTRAICCERRFCLHKAANTGWLEAQSAHLQARYCQGQTHKAKQACYKTPYRNHCHVVESDRTYGSNPG